MKEEKSSQETETILLTLMHGNQLKRTVRTGWVQRGIANPENVAAHSFGVVYAVLALAQLVTEPIVLEKALAMAALHDLPEGLTTDIPTPAWRYLPQGIKTQVERSAMQEMLAGTPFEPWWMMLWEELHMAETAESRLVHDADKLDMFIQAYMYEKQTGNLQLAEFWAKPHVFYYPEVQTIYDALRTMREVE
ncbi:MAG: HD family hydrolase [Candidatus Promineifilaceae bacterium]